MTFENRESKIGDSGALYRVVWRWHFFARLIKTAKGAVLIVVLLSVLLPLMATTLALLLLLDLACGRQLA